MSLLIFSAVLFEYLGGFDHLLYSLVSQTAIKSFGATGQDLGIGLKSKFDPKLVA